MNSFILGAVKNILCTTGLWVCVSTTERYQDLTDILNQLAFFDLLDLLHFKIVPIGSQGYFDKIVVYNHITSSFFVLGFYQERRRYFVKFSFHILSLVQSASSIGLETILFKYPSSRIRTCFFGVDVLGTVLTRIPDSECPVIILTHTSGL